MRRIAILMQFLFFGHVFLSFFLTIVWNTVYSAPSDLCPSYVLLCAGGCSHSGRTGLSLRRQQKGAGWIRLPPQSPACQPAGRVRCATCSAAVQHSGTLQRIELHKVSDFQFSVEVILVTGRRHVFVPAYYLLVPSGKTHKLSGGLATSGVCH